MYVFYVLVCLTGLVSSNSPIQDGETKTHSIDSWSGGSKEYEFFIGEPISQQDLTISVTAASGWSDPDLYVNMNEEVSTTEYIWKSLEWGDDSVIVPASNIEANSTFYILVNCFTRCSFHLTVHYEEFAALESGTELVGQVGADDVLLYSFEIPVDSQEITITMMPIRGNATLVVSSHRDFSSPLPTEYSWNNGQYFHSVDLSISQYFIKVQGREASTFSIVATHRYDTPIVLRGASPVGGVVDSGRMRYYTAEVFKQESDLKITLTQFSGVSELYVSVKTKPTLQEHDYFSTEYGLEQLVITSEERATKDQETGVFYIGVYGRDHASYTLSYSEKDDEFITLAPGVPQSGSASSGSVSHYTLNLDSKITAYNISVHLTPQSGNPDLYVYLCNTVNQEDCLFKPEYSEDPEQYGVYTSVHNDGPESIMFVHPGDKCALDIPCGYVVAVLGSSAELSTYTVTGTEDTEEEYVLRNGHPMSMSLNSEGYLYFKYTVHNQTATKLEFLLTPLSGDPDLYVSIDGHPTVDEYDKKSVNRLTEVDRVVYERGQDFESLVQTYYVGVHSSAAVSFSVVAQETRPVRTSTIHLYPGHPQRDTVYEVSGGSYRIYYFNTEFTEETKQDLRIVLTTLSGTFSLYAANDPTNVHWDTNRFSYQWMDRYNSSDPQNVINIRTDDPNYRLASTYLVLCKANEFTSDGTASYSVMYQVSGSVIMLTEDVAYTDQIMSEEYKYYTFRIHQSLEDVKVTLTAISGDPDLYISVDPANRRPTKDNNDVSSLMFGSDVVMVTWEHYIQPFCSWLTDEYSHGDEAECVMYIGVYGYSQAHYSITVHPSRDVPQHIPIGTPQVGQLAHTEFDYYYTRVNTENIVTITVQPTDGDPDLFVNLVSSNEDDPTAWERPTRDFADYSSQSATFAETVTIATVNSTATCGSDDCLVLIGVYCFSENCGYTLTVTQQDNLVLVENEPKYGVVDLNEYILYEYYCNNPSNNLVISLTSLNGGDPDLFVAKGRNGDPIESPLWSSVRFGNDTLVITPESAAEMDVEMMGTFVIAVKGVSEGCSYMITVNNHPTPIIRLVGGVPASGSLEANSAAYFYFFNTLETNVTITLTPQSGSVMMTVTDVADDAENLDELYANLPTKTNFLWDSATSNDQHIINIMTTDEHFCYFCEFIIGVFSDQSPATFSISVGSDLAKQALRNGVPVKGQLSEDQTHYYTFTILEETTLDVVLNAYSGDPDLYVGFYNEDGEFDMFWESTRVSKVDHVRISPDGPKFTVGTYFIEVQGFEESSYSLVAHTKNTYIRLVEGWALYYSLEANPADYVLFRYDTQDRLRCTLQPLTENYFPSVYLRTETTKQNVPIPGPNTADPDASYSKEDYDRIYNMLSIEMQSSDNYYNMGVYSTHMENDGSTTYNNLPGLFEIKCISGHNTMILKANDQMFIELGSQSTSKKFEVSYATPGHAKFHVIPCSGDYKFSVHREWSVTDDEIAGTEEKSNGIYQDSVRISEAGTYYVVVELKTADKFFGINSFELVTMFAATSVALPEPLIAGHEGLVEVSGQFKTVLTTWEPVLYANNTAYENPDAVVYLVYATPHTDMPFSNGCSVYIASLYDKAKRVHAESNIDKAKFDRPYNGDFLITTIAVVERSWYDGIRQVAYKPVHVNRIDLKSNSKLGIIIFWIVAVLLALFIALAVWFWKKYKGMKKKYEYEMSDIRAYAGSVSSGQIDSNKISASASAYAVLQA